jgi:hypothetical protein
LNYCRSLCIQADGIVGNHKIGQATQQLFAMAKACSTKAQKFMLPKNGNVLDDDRLQGIDPSSELRLPFQAIALEYMSESIVSSDAPIKSSKRIVLAEEVDDGIIVMPVCFIDEMAVWSMYGALMISKTNSFCRPMFGPVQVALPISILSENEYSVNDYADEVCALISFLNALNCKNVSIGRSVTKHFGKKIKPAYPFDSYNILSVEVQAEASTSTGLQRDVRSPREHLRRGHIRNLADGRKVWVNSAVVAAGVGGGLVGKTYAVCA